MTLTINTNLASINGQRNLSNSASSLSTAMQRLSSGVRVNSAKDDAAGLAIADRMTSQVRGMTVAVRNANDGVSLTQTAEGALGSLTDTLQRMRDLAVQSSSNAGVSASDRAKMQTEFKALNDELIRVVQNSEFNGKKILNGDLAGGLNIQVGATTDTNSRISVAVSNMSTLLTPITSATLSPASQPMDSTLASEVTNKALAASTGIASVLMSQFTSSAVTPAIAAVVDPTTGVVTTPATLAVIDNTIADAARANIAGVTDTSIQLANANLAAKLANAAVVAAKAAAAAPTDMALAKAASAANLAAATAIAGASNAVKSKTTENLGLNLVSDAFSITVNAADSSNTAAQAAIITTNVNVQSASTTDAAQSASLLTTATQLATAAAAAVEDAGQNSFAVTMNTLTGDTINRAATAFDTTINKLTTSNTLNDAINRATTGTFLGDRGAQKALVAAQIAKAIAGASYINDPLATATSNETNKTSFINNNKLMVSASTAADAVAADYALSAINYIDGAIASIDTERSNLGSTQNRFTTTVSNLQSGIENQSAAKSRITDADFAQETANLSRAQILQQAGTAMLAQANQSGQSVMTLLR